jgi:hypothetical protein
MGPTVPNLTDFWLIERSFIGDLSAIVAFGERSLNLMLGSYAGPAAAAKIIKPTSCLLSLRDRDFLVSMGETEGAASGNQSCSCACNGK